MPLTKENMLKVNALVKEGRVDAARVLLESLDGDKAAAALVKLNAAYPPTPTPKKRTAVTETPSAAAPIDEMEPIKTAIREKRFDDAEALLILSHHPEAEMLRQRLGQIRGTSRAAPPAKVKKPLSTAATIRRTVIVGLLIFVCIAAVSLYSDYKRRDEELAHKLKIEFALDDVCFEVYWEEYFDKWGASRFNAACDKEIDFMTTIYTETVERCVNTWGEETNKLIECLADGGASFAGGYMASGNDS